MRIPLGIDDAYLLLAPRGADLGVGWQIALIALTLSVPVTLVLWLSRYEMQLIRRRHALGLCGLRLLLIFALWAIVAFQPVVAHLDTPVVSSTVRVAVDLSGSMDVSDRQRTTDEAEALAAALSGTSSEVAGWSRKEIVRRALSPAGHDLLRRLALRHHVELVGFHDMRWAVDTAAWESLFAPADDAKDARHDTDLRQPLFESGSADAPPLAGIVVFTDGRHNRGETPLVLARQLGEVGVPIFPVALGSKRPPTDVMLTEFQMPAKAFKDTTVPVVVRVKAMNMPAQELTVESRGIGKAALLPQRQKLKHSGGDATYDVKFEVPMDTVGTHAVETRVIAGQGGEITLENNQRTRIIRVVEDRARVLLVDDEARWEYHYLAGALGRDPTLRLDRILFAPPHLGVIKGDDLDQSGLPKLHLPLAPSDAAVPDPLLDYDCIILGDVAPEKLPPADRKRLERYVAERGGTLIFVAGKRSLPLAYTRQPDAANDSLLKLLPIREPRVFERKDGFNLRLTASGQRAPYLRLDKDWGTLPKHYWSVVGIRQPGATVLAVPQPIEPKEDDRTGLLVQQNYGAGMVVFVGIDSTWRWRFKTGDAIHHRFWGQLVRWAAADRLLPAGNRLVRFGPREPVYAAGQPIELAVRLAEDAPALAKPRAKLLRQMPDRTETVAAIVPLEPNAQQKKLLEGKAGDPLPAGTYRMELDIAELGDLPPSPGAVFTILPEESSEMLDLSTNWELLQGLADQSHGRLFTPDNLDQVLELLAQRVQPHERAHDSKLWQDEPLVWWLLGFIVGLLALEWGWRKALELP